MTTEQKKEEEKREPEELKLETLKAAVAGTAAAFRCVTEYQPAGGPSDKVFPPTYEGGKYATEERIIGGQKVKCVLLNSVQSEANHMELALLDAWEEKHDGKRRIGLPVISVNFNFQVKGVPKSIRVTSLDAPHRVADAIFRDSLHGATTFRKSETGRLLDTTDVRNATGLYRLCPTALVFGLWDSAGPRGGLGSKFQRAIVSEIVGVDAVPGVATGGKVDHLNILIDAGKLYKRAEESDSQPHWTLDEKLSLRSSDKQPVVVGKHGKPSEANLGGVTPDFAYARDERKNIIRDNEIARIKGGFTIEKAVQTTVLSLAALRRLRFPLEGKKDEEQAEVNRAAQTVLAALGLCAATLAREKRGDLRSRCQLEPTDPFVWKLLDVPGDVPKPYVLNSDNAVELFNAAVGEANALGLKWEGEIELTPSDDLLALVQRSHEIAAGTGAEGTD